MPLFKRAIKRAKFAIPLIFFILIIGFLWHGLKINPSMIPSPLINQPAPEFKLPQLFYPNETISNDDFIGRVTLLNVWATWCHACIEEHDFLLKIASIEDLKIVGLNYKDDVVLAKRWLQDNGNPYHVVAVDSSGSTGIDWGVYGTPETFIIDKKGVIRYKHIGPIDANVWEKTLHPIVIQLRNETL